jgi:hypothetical protein
LVMVTFFCMFYKTEFSVHTLFRTIAWIPVPFLIICQIFHLDRIFHIRKQISSLRGLFFLKQKIKEVFFIFLIFNFLKVLRLCI